MDVKMMMMRMISLIDQTFVFSVSIILTRPLLVVLNESV